MPDLVDREKERRAKLHMQIGALQKRLKALSPDGDTHQKVAYRLLYLKIQKLLRELGQMELPL